jgi:hypothetical protein
MRKDLSLQEKASAKDALKIEILEYKQLVNIKKKEANRLRTLDVADNLDFQRQKR